ncbi:hypothetical protein ACKXF4_00270 [Faecalibacterium prausnitzii]
MSVWWTTPAWDEDVINKLENHKVNTKYIQARAGRHGHLAGHL